MNKPDLQKTALVVGTGRWGKIMIKVLIENQYKVFYANRNLEIDKILENSYFNEKIEIHSEKYKDQYDILLICVKPYDIYNVWEKYREFSMNILIEKPGPLESRALEKIYHWARLKKVKILLNYEFFYTETSISLRNILKKDYQLVSQINITWQKKLGPQGDLNWRLLPHLISEVYFYNQKYNLIKYYEQVDSLKASAKIGLIPVEFEIKESLIPSHRVKVLMNDGNIYHKDEKKLQFNDVVLVENKNASLSRMINFFNIDDPFIFEINQSMSLFIIKLINEFKNISL